MHSSMTNLVEGDSAIPTLMKTFFKAYPPYQFTIRLLHHSMLPVIRQVSVACAVNGFGPPLPGAVQGLGMTVHLLFKSRMDMAFEA